MCITYQLYVAKIERGQCRSSSFRLGEWAGRDTLISQNVCSRHLWRRKKSLLAPFPRIFGGGGKCRLRPSPPKLRLGGGANTVIAIFAIDSGVTRRERGH